MKKRILSLIVISLAAISTISAQEVNPEMQAFLERIEDSSLDELEKELDEGIEGLKTFMGFFEAPAEEPKTITKEEERLTEPFRIDTSIVKSATQQFEDIGFTQTFKENKSFLKFQKIGDDYWSKVFLTEGIEEWFTPKKIHFKDGTSAIKGIKNNKISFFWDEEWADIKVIDSVEIDYNIRYTKAYDSLQLTKKTKKLNYKQGVVKVKKIEKNHLYITISDAYADGVYLRALNKDGKPLSQNSSSFSPTSDDSSSDVMKEMLSVLEEVQSRLKQDKFADVEQLKKYLIKKASKIDKTKDTDGVSHRKFYFNGNIDTVVLYFQTEEGFQTVPFKAINSGSFKNILLNQTKEQLIFMDEDAKEIFRIDEKPLERIGNRFFMEDETYYYLNITNKSLDKMAAVNVYETSNGHVFIQQNLEHGFIAHDINLKKLSDLEFSNVWYVNNEYAHALSNDKEVYTLDSEGNIKKVDGVDEIVTQSEGLTMVRSNEKYGFMDVSGKVIVPCTYADAEAFSEGLAIIKNDEGQYGFVDKTGEIILPLVYNRANSFENGIALVSKGDGYLLIDKTGKVIVKTDSNGYFINGTGVQKTYQLGDKKYDAFGKLISQE
ncbi:WG repeat-containing protein [Maribacter sp. 2308TA10-17]|uniref:WG repeat-containing protein n=1 Tax=Maribacter sp. 2308TA10-17 TaxID=3386276 RepID=UPI0039BD643D